MKKQWNKDIRDQLKDFPKKAPEGLLDDIKSEMLRRGLPTAPVADKPKRLYPLILRRVASVAAVLLILLGLSHLWEKPATLPGLTEHMEAPLEPILPFSDTVVEAAKEQPLASLPSSRIAQAEKPASIPLEIPEKEEEESTDKEQAEEQPQANDAPEAKKEYTKTSPKPKWTYNVSSRKKSSFSFGIYYSAQGELNRNTGEYELNAKPNNPLPDNSGEGGGTPPVENPGNMGGDHSNQPDTTSVVLSRSARSTYDLKNFRGTATHHLPVKLGLSIRYGLSERWSLLSGLTYSYLASNLEETCQNEKYEIKQKLHYIGIPLQIGYRIWENKPFRGYLAAGVQMEKLISGKATIHHSKNGLLMETPTQNVSDKRLLFSALASVGAEYALKKDVSLYVESGIQHYFKNGNGLQTHYNEQPLNLSLTLGFRFHWKK